MAKQRQDWMIWDENVFKLCNKVINGLVCWSQLPITPSLVEVQASTMDTRVLATRSG